MTEGRSALCDEHSRTLRKARLRLLQMHYEAGVGHIGGNLSALDVTLLLHQQVMGPADTFVLSKGHSVGALYVTLWVKGELSDDQLQLFHADGSRMAGHPVPGWTPGIPVATGSLGHGLPVACGIALARKLESRPGHVYCLTSDGEWQEGSNWEAIIFANHRQLDRLTVLVDANRLQGFGTTSEVASMDGLAGRIRSFGIEVDEVDGHDPVALERGLRARSAGPRALILHTVKGKGVSFMENQMSWHYLPLTDELYAQAVREIELFRDHSFVFMTGDLGFKALEPLREVMGERFVNAGIAEQNMVSVAAGMASQGLDVWAYSIAPFCYARPFEQIRNDLCQHGFPVKLVGNGGGYGYGAMGATHHALEDYGALLTLQKLRVYVPAFAEDLRSVIPTLSKSQAPTYLRLGRCEKPQAFELGAYAPWRKLLSGEGAVVVAAGPVVGGLLAALGDLDEAARPDLWVVSELPIEAAAMPNALLGDLKRSRRLMVVEEHVSHGGVGHMLSTALLEAGVKLDGFVHACAQGYPSGTYGSQLFHRRECGLAPEQLLATIGRLQHQS